MDSIKKKYPAKSILKICSYNIKKILRRLQISQEDCWRPIKAYIEWAQRRYKRINYTTMNRVQRLERKRMYIRHIAELKKVHTFLHTHTLKAWNTLFTPVLISPLPFLVIDFTIGDSVAGTTLVTTQRGFHS